MARGTKNGDVPRIKVARKRTNTSGPVVRVHYVPSFFLEPREPVTVTLVGAGGTGSQVLSYLARLNLSLLAMGHPGIYVNVYDDKTVTEANVARQLFFPGEIGTNKAVTLVQRINRLFGFRWLGIPEKFGNRPNQNTDNIIIGCVDDMKARKMILDIFKGGRSVYNETQMIYYIDAGNTKNSGQVLVQSKNIKQPKSNHHTIHTLPNIEEEFGKQIWDIKSDNQPSCSIAAALAKQDLYINAIMAVNVSAFVWKILHEHILTIRGVYINLETMTTNPIPV